MLVYLAAELNEFGVFRIGSVRFGNSLLIDYFIHSGWLEDGS